MKFKMKDLFSPEYIKGFKQGIILCKKVARDQGYRLVVPNLDEIEVKKK